jgi:peptide deformylase
MVYIGLRHRPLPPVTTRFERAIRVRIVYYPDPVLLRKADILERVPDDLPEIVEGMRHVMGLERGIGLAAPQVGLSIRLLLANPSGKPEDEKVLINPEIVKFHGKKIWDEEGCLSFPGIFGEVLRYSHVDVEYFDCDMKKQTLQAQDLMSRVMQHEIDHLNGVLFVTRMRPGDKVANQQRLKELREQYEALKAV